MLVGGEPSYSCAYSGHPVTPGVAVTGADGRALAEGEDYALEYSGNVGPGTATVTVTGRDGYAGTATATFRIVASSRWVRQGPSWYWYGADGEPARGWARVGGSWYYLDPSSGELRSGWLEDGGSRYYLDPADDSRMATGWRRVGGSWYLLAPGGQMLSGWQSSGGRWYYLDASGAMATGRRQIGGKWYEFGVGLETWRAAPRRPGGRGRAPERPSALAASGIQS